MLLGGNVPDVCGFDRTCPLRLCEVSTATLANNEPQRRHTFFPLSTGRMFYDLLPSMHRLRHQGIGFWIRELGGCQFPNGSLPHEDFGVGQVAVVWRIAFARRPGYALLNDDVLRERC